MAKGFQVKAAEGKVCGEAQENKVRKHKFPTGLS